MKLKITYKKVVARVEFPDAPMINRAELARRLGVTRSMVTHMIATGDVPARFLEPLRAIDTHDVMSRKPNGG